MSKIMELEEMLLLKEQCLEELEAKLAVAVEALRFYADGGRFYDIANEALEKINEEK